MDNCMDEILRAMRKREHQYKVPNYIDSPLPPTLKGRKVVDEKCRRQMCEWSYQITAHCGFGKETASIAMNLLDRFLAATPWALTDMSAFQLASITALYTSIKIHESQAIAVESMVMLSRNVYTEEQIEAMERMMLETTKWLVNPPTATAFGWRMAKMFSAMDEKRFPFETLLDLINVQLEAAVKHFSVCTMAQSLLAVGAVMNALESLGMTCPIEQRQTLGNLCNVLEITDTGMEYMDAVRNQLYENMSGVVTPTKIAAAPAAAAVSDDEFDHSEDGCSSIAPMHDEDSTAIDIRPTSPNSVSAVHAASHQHKLQRRHPSQVLPAGVCRQ
ncbi:MAG: hypothetical protein SGARI_005261 [Bacillariaceae sp.]